jgi:hypothetical protein
MGKKDRMERDSKPAPLPGSREYEKLKASKMGKGGQRQAREEASDDGIFFI